MPAPAHLPLDARRREPSFAPNRHGAMEAAAASPRAASDAQHVTRQRRSRRQHSASRLRSGRSGGPSPGLAQQRRRSSDARDGHGYWLGIAGASAMLLLLLYPLRKRMKSLRGLGSVGGWFRLHMVLGVIGPALILFHSNFKLGSLNSNVALFSMLTVAASGLIGRYLYGRVHLGLYGRRAEIEELLTDVDNLKTRHRGGCAAAR